MIMSKITFRKVVRENINPEPLTEDQVNTLRHSCSECIELTKKLEKPFFRGSKTMPKHFHSRQISSNRMRKDTSNTFNLCFNWAIQQKFGIKDLRNTCTFAVPNFHTAEEYGSVAYFFIPNGFEAVANKHYSDTIDFRGASNLHLKVFLSSIGAMKYFSEYTIRAIASYWDGSVFSSFNSIIETLISLGAKSDEIANFKDFLENEWIADYEKVNSSNIQSFALSEIMFKPSPSNNTYFMLPVPKITDSLYPKEITGAYFDFLQKYSL